MEFDAAAIAAVLGGPPMLGREVATMRDLDDAVREGIPKQALDRVVMLIVPSGVGAITCARLRNKIVPRATYQQGMSAADVLADYPNLRPEDIGEALRYAAAAVNERQLPLVASA